MNIYIVFKKKSNILILQQHDHYKLYCKFFLNKII